jgi:tRNA (guanine-N7-)-methyltransferase
MSVAESSTTEAALGRSPYADAPRLPPGSSLGAVDILGRGARERELELEIGPGRGGFIFERLAAAPDVCIVGLEIRLKWASQLDERRVFAEDIRVALPRFAAGSLSRIFIHFPDPWWKKRHAKRRLAQADVMDHLVRVLAAGGELFVQTDVWDTAQAYREVIERRPELEPHGEQPGSPLLSENPYAARSPRERRVMADGMPVVRLRYRRRSGVPV